MMGFYVNGSLETKKKAQLDFYAKKVDHDEFTKAFEHLFVNKQTAQTIPLIFINNGGFDAVLLVNNRYDYELSFDIGDDPREMIMYTIDRARLLEIDPDCANALL